MYINVRMMIVRDKYFYSSIKKSSHGLDKKKIGTFIADGLMTDSDDTNSTVLHFDIIKKKNNF